MSLKAKEGVELMKTLLSKAPSGCSDPNCKCSTGQQCGCASNKNKDLWRADVLIDPFRPGVLERLGLGPDVLLKQNPSLIIARLTGFRREGECALALQPSMLADLPVLQGPTARWRAMI